MPDKRIPPTPQELDRVLADLEKRPTLAQQFGRTDDVYDQIEAAVKDVLPESYQPPEDPAITRLFARIDRLEKQRLRRLPKAIREGETVDVLLDGLRRVRTLYRDNGWSATQIRNHTEAALSVVWEWVDRLPKDRKDDFLKVYEWEDLDKFLYLQIATLYKDSGHAKKLPSWQTVRDWRSAFRKYQKSLQR